MSSGIAARRRSSATASSSLYPHLHSSSSAAVPAFEKPKEPFRINNIPLPPPGSSRRPSVSSSIASRIPKRELKQLNALTSAAHLGAVNSSSSNNTTKQGKSSHQSYNLQSTSKQPQSGPIYPLSSNNSTGGGDGTSRKHSLVHPHPNRKNSKHRNNHHHHEEEVVEIYHRSATSAETWFKPRKTLSESTSKLNEMMATNLNSIEKTKRKSIFNKTQVGNGDDEDDDGENSDNYDGSEYDDDEDDSELLLEDTENGSLTSNEMSLTFDKDGKPLQRPSRRRKRKNGKAGGGKKTKWVKVIKSIRNDATGEMKEVEVEEEVTDNDDDEDPNNRSPSGAQLTVALLEQAAALVGILAPESQQDHRKNEKTGPTEEELEAERQRLWEMNNRIRPADDDYRDFLCPKRWSAHRRIDAKLDFFRNSDSASARLQDRMKFYKQVDRETTIAARDSQEYRHRKLSAVLSGRNPPPRPPSATARPRSARSWMEEKKRREAAAATAHPTNNTTTTSATSDQRQDSKTTNNTTQASSSNTNNNNSNSSKASLKDYLPKRPQSARNPSSTSFHHHNNSHHQQNNNHNNDNENFVDDDQNDWVQRNYGEFHHIPIVEIPPRSAGEWHRRNEIWLVKRLKNRPEEFRKRKMAEHEKLSEAFHKHHKNDPAPPTVRIPIL